MAESPGFGGIVHQGDGLGLQDLHIAELSAGQQHALGCDFHRQ